MVHARAERAGDAAEVGPLPCKRGLRTMHRLPSPSPHSLTSAVHPQLKSNGIAAATGGLGALGGAAGCADRDFCFFQPAFGAMANGKCIPPQHAASVSQSKSKAMNEDGGALCRQPNAPIPRATDLHVACMLAIAACQIAVKKRY